MKLIFWICAALITYAYVGYALWLMVYARLRSRPVARTQATPTVSIVMAVRNEEHNLPRKLDNLRRLTYPQTQLQVIIVSDGSTDRTGDILTSQAPFVLPILLPHSGGKAAALNAAVRMATGDLLVFLDARQTNDLNAVSELAACFADPGIGAVSGELLLETAAGEPDPDALGIYWKIEKTVRRLESASGSVVGATGAIYAIRRELYVDLPPGTLLDDVFIPMHVARLGKRVVFQSTAIARDRIFNQKGKEFSRKVRTLTGNYQLLQLAPWLLSPANPLLFRLISHKLLRLAVPILLPLLLLSSLFAEGSFYHAVFLLQLLFYVAAGSGVVNPNIRRFKPVSIANTFVMLNAAAAVALYNVIVGRKGIWA